MENNAYKKVTVKLLPFFESVGLKKVESDDGDVFVNDKKAVKISYNTSNSQVSLDVADVVENGIGTFSSMSQWLLDDSTTDRDISSIANDFEDTARQSLGCKNTSNAAAVDMPRASAGDSKTPDDIAQKLLAVFPELKNDYSQHMAENNEFYYVEFFENKAVPLICGLLDSGEKKKISKFIASLNEMYIEGTKETTAIVAYTLLGGAGAVDTKYEEIITEYISDYQYLKIVMPYVFKLTKKEAKKK